MGLAAFVEGHYFIEGHYVDVLAANPLASPASPVTPAPALAARATADLRRHSDSTSPRRSQVRVSGIQ